MIIISVPINIPDNDIINLESNLDNRIKYDFNYSGKRFRIEKQHISLVKINSDELIDNSLKTHIMTMISSCITKKIAFQ